MSPQTPAVDINHHNYAPALSRRGMLASAAALTAAALVPSIARAQSAQPPAPALIGTSGKRPRNVIFMVADGMSNGALAFADEYLRMTTGQPSAWRHLSSQRWARRALQSTRSANSIVTDSAAASAAWSTGVKHDNGALCISPSGKALTPLLLRAKAGGKRTGCVTTTTITHATPAGFYCNVTKRGSEDQIGEQLCQRPIDVALGGGQQFVAESDVKKAGNIHLAFTRDELAAALASTKPDTRLIGLFNNSHISMKIDRDTLARTKGRAAVTEPSLLELTQAALARLSADTNGSDGFILQIEAGRVDHGAHANDAVGVLHDLIEFDATLTHVHEWASSRNDTLVIVTTDHATGGCSPVFYGLHGVESLRRLATATHSFEWILSELGSPDSPAAGAAQLVKLAESALGFALASDAEGILRKVLANEYVPLFSMQRKLSAVLGAIIANQTGIAFSTDGHNADFTDLFAFGPGSESLPTFVENTDVHTWLTQALDLRPA